MGRTSPSAELWPVAALASWQRLPSVSILIVVRPVSRGLPDQPVDLPCHIGPHRVHHVLVSRGHGRGRPPNEAHDGPLGYAEDEQHRGGGVARVVQPPVSHLRLHQQCLPLGPSLRWEGLRPCSLGNTQSPSTQRFPTARRSSSWTLRWARSRSTSCSGRPTARRPARDLVTEVSGLLRRLSGQYPAFPSAGVAAAVRVLRPAATPTDHEEPTLQVYVLPLQGQRLPLTQPEGERDGPACRIPLPTRGLQEPLHLFDCVGLRLVVARLRSLGQLDGVLAEVAAAYGLVECGAEGAVYLVSGRGLAAVGLHLRVEDLDMLRLEPVETVRSKSGDEVWSPSGVVVMSQNSSTSTSSGRSSLNSLSNSCRSPRSSASKTAQECQGCHARPRQHPARPCATADRCRHALVTDGIQDLCSVENCQAVIYFCFAGSLATASCAYQSLLSAIKIVNMRCRKRKDSRPVQSDPRVDVLE